MYLEHVIQSEVSQKEKNKYHILTYIYIYIYLEYRKMVLMNLLMGKKWKYRYREWMCGHSGGRKEWDEQRN